MIHWIAARLPWVIHPVTCLEGESERGGAEGVRRCSMSSVETELWGPDARRAQGHSRRKMNTKSGYHLALPEISGEFKRVVFE
jgi:hypothetical protein